MNFLRNSTALLSQHHSLLRHSAHPLRTISRRTLVVLPQPPLEELDEPMDEPLEKLTLDISASAIAVRPSPVPSLDSPADSPPQQITKAQALSKDPLLSLRISVESGGCHGYQYKMVTTSTREPDDLYVPLPSPFSPCSPVCCSLFQPPAPHPPARLVVDPSSLALLSGSTIDYATELIGSSFRINSNPHASDKGGCGCGVSEWIRGS